VQGRELPQVNEPVDHVLKEIRSRLPLRVRLLGEARLKEIIGIAIQEWPTDMQLSAGDGDHKEAVWKSLEEQVKQSFLYQQDVEKKYGFAILTLILASAISTIVQQMILWWLHRPKNRELMAQWHPTKQ
jgi:hypothetical protein